MFQHRSGRCLGCDKPSPKQYCSNACIKANRKDRFCAICAPTVRERVAAVNVCKRCRAKEREAGTDTWHGPADELAEWSGIGPRPQPASRSRVAVKVGGGKWRQRDTGLGVRRTTESRDESETRRRRILQLFMNRHRRDVPYFDRRGRQRGTRSRWVWLSQREIAAEVGVDESYVSQVVAGVNRDDGGIVARIIVDISRLHHGNLNKATRSELERSVRRLRGRGKERPKHEHTNEQDEYAEIEEPTPEPDEDGPIDPPLDCIEPGQ